jgi:hypothetical protein
LIAANRLGSGYRDFRRASDQRRVLGPRVGDSLHQPFGLTPQPANARRALSGFDTHVDRMTHSTALVISAHGLVKNFGNVRDLDGLDLEVREGEVHGFLRPNGAGMATTDTTIETHVALIITSNPSRTGSVPTNSSPELATRFGSSKVASIRSSACDTRVTGKCLLELVDDPV